MTEYIKTTDAITTTWMILRGMGYAAEDNPDMVKTVSAVFDTAPAADVVERPRWISVKERMPEDGKNVLAYEGGGFYFLDWCCDGDWVVASASTAVVTHWMSLPEPPEGQK